MMSLMSLSLCLAALAQDAEPDTRPRPVPAAIEQALRGPRTVQPIPPAGRDLEGKAGTMEKLRDHLTVKSRLWPEGTTLALRRGHLALDPAPRFVFTDGTGEEAGGSMGLLPNSKLDQMENYVAAAPDRTIEFRIIGSVTEYRGANHLILREVDIVNSPSAAAQTHTPAADDRGAEVRSDVLDVLLDETESVEPLPPTANKPRYRSAARRESMARWPEGTRLVSRVGRLIEDGGDWRYVFESASEALADPPVTLLKNLALQSMIDMSDAGRLGVVFVVSGEITESDGENFMLVRRFSLRRDDGNLQ